MILKVHLEGAASYDVGDEIWQVALSNAIQAEAESIVYSAGSDLLESGDNQLRDRTVAEMSGALLQVGDTYRAPDGVLYSLIEPPADEDDGDTLTAVSSAVPVVEEVIRFEDLPVGSLGTRRAVVRWSDGTEGEGLKWYGDEIMISEGDHRNSRLMSPPAEMHRAAGSVHAPRGT
jgi:hypothetical protein